MGHPTNRARPQVLNRVPALDVGLLKQLEVVDSGTRWMRSPWPAASPTAVLPCARSSSQKVACAVLAQAMMR